jgi:hypothetical protein
MQTHREHFYMCVPANLDVYVHSDRERDMCVGIDNVCGKYFFYKVENAIFCPMQTHRELTETVDKLSLEKARLIKVGSFYSLLSCLIYC